ncbi:MAG: hypothetical protein AB7J63_19065 [Vicinamibacterales bacterium]
MRSAMTVLLAAICASVTSTSCGSGRDPSTGERLTPEYDAATGRLTRITYDRDGDGKPDTWGVLGLDGLARVDIDEDSDRQVDRLEYYERDAGTGESRLVRIERALDAAGRPARREFLVDGVLARVEADTNADGQVDVWQVFADGRLVTVEIDTDHVGYATRRLTYSPDGAVSVTRLDRSTISRTEPR